MRCFATRERTYMDKNNGTLAHAESKDLAEKIVSVLLEKSGIDVRLYYVKEASSVTDYYVNVTGRSSTNVMALADEVTYQVGLLGREPNHTEGRDGRAWVLVDYTDVVLNVFDKESREFYNFDRLLPEDSLVDISHIVAEIDAKFDINKN